MLWYAYSTSPALLTYSLSEVLKDKEKEAKGKRVEIGMGRESGRNVCTAVISEGSSLAL